MENDIKSEEDVETWLNTFYSKLLEDPITKPKFEGLDLNEHMPKIIAFWSFVLLEKDGYRTNVFEKHIHLGLELIHFERWLFHFEKTTDEMFKGPNAEIAKQRVKLLATTFLSKLGGGTHIF